MNEYSFSSKHATILEKGCINMGNSIKTKSDTFQHGDVFGVNCTIKTPSIAMSVHSFVVDGVVIDTGSKTLRREFDPFFQESDFDQIVLTHFHEDHTGNAARLREQYDVPIYIHQMSAHLTEEKQRIPLYRKLVWGDVETFSSKPLTRTFQSRQDRWRVIDTPGHTKDHASFLNESKGILFTGDLFIAPKVKVVLIDENIIDTLHSLKKIMTLDFEDIYCQHAGHLKNPHKMIHLKIDYLEELEGTILTLQKEGKDIYEITAELFPNNYPIIAASNTEWSPIHIVRAFLNRG